MREYRDRMVQEIAVCTCDRCSQRMSPDDDQGEWYEKVSLDWRGGFGSVFGDGAHLSAYSTQIERPFCGKASKHSTRNRAGIPQQSERCGHGDAG
ncbi:hypothetical protein OKW41_002760 [Paraburkholderia sp. UCT70]|uniref:hypothetical protein n=1 Tax=Paraburkholderia sp. UCT70 TaxID=2991068 RepID=UPI003D19091A